MSEHNKTSGISRRQFIQSSAALGGLALLGGTRMAEAKSAPIRIGVISPLTGPWTVYGKAHLEGIQLATEEINAAGGVLGREFKLEVMDSQTQPSIVARDANRLVRAKNVDFLAGTFSSAARNAAAPVVTSADKVLLYPTFYEGQQQQYYPGVCNPNIFMFGPVPSQQVWPHMEYMVKKYGKKFYMVGSDYVWPRVTNEVTKEKLKELGGTVVGEQYIPFNTPNYESTLNDIKKAKPDVIFLTLTGSDTVNFRKQFANSGMKKDFALWTVDDGPIVTHSLGPDVAGGAYVSFDYFMSIKGENNQRFLKKFHKRFGNDKLMNTVGVAMYNIGHMAAMALQKEGKVSTDALRRGLKGLTFDGAPQGPVTMRAEDNQAVLPSYLMQVNDSWSSPMDMFTQIRHVPHVAPKTADCSHLPLKA